MDKKPEYGEVIPIDRGKEIQLERLNSRVKELRDQAMDLYGRMLDLEIEKQVQLDQELGGPTTEQNIKLISLLTHDLDEIHSNEDALMKAILEGGEYLTELRERLDALLTERR